MFPRERVKYTFGHFSQFVFEAFEQPNDGPPSRMMYDAKQLMYADYPAPPANGRKYRHWCVELHTHPDPQLKSTVRYWFAMSVRVCRLHRVVAGHDDVSRVNVYVTSFDLDVANPTMAVLLQTVGPLRCVPD